MKIIDLFNNKKPVLSFEIFPPKQDMPLESIYERLDEFKALNPDYISVTYSAAGSGGKNTIEIASKIKNSLKVESMAHFTCVGQTREAVAGMLSKMHNMGLENILALRGDYPERSAFSGPENFDYRYASDLIKHIKSTNNFCIAAAAYIEGHVDSMKLRNDLNHLKIKVDNGVDFLITQLFFDNRLFYDFIDKASAIGINCPVSAGVMPIFKSDQIKSICVKSGCSIPAKLVLMMDKYNDKPEDLRKAGIDYAARQIRDLIDNGADGVHIYTMNRPMSTKKILEDAGMM